MVKLICYGSRFRVIKSALEETCRTYGNVTRNKLQSYGSVREKTRRACGNLTKIGAREMGGPTGNCN